MLNKGKKYVFDDPRFFYSFIPYLENRWLWQIMMIITGMMIITMMMMMMRNFIKLNPRAVKLKRNVIIGTKLAYTLTYLLTRKTLMFFKRKDKDIISRFSPRHMNPFQNRLRTASYGRHPTDWEAHLSTIHLFFNLYVSQFLSSA